MTFRRRKCAKIAGNAPAGSAVNMKIITAIWKWPEKGKWVRIRPKAEVGALEFVAVEPPFARVDDLIG